MHLASIDIKNFRSIKELHIDLQPGLNALVGRNNTGKTSLLEAIRHALGPAASRGDSLWLERDDFYRANAVSAPATSLSIWLTFAGLTEGQRAYFYEIVDFDLANLNNSKAIVRFEASWPAGKKHATVKRTGGPITPDQPEVPTSILESLPVTFLPALRDAEAALAPGYRSRLALLLRDIAERPGSTMKTEVEGIFTRANGDLTGLQHVLSLIGSLCARTEKIAGTDHSPSTIKATDVEFDKILRTLHVQMASAPVGALSANGLGFNNLLYMAVVLEHLKRDSAEESPLLLVEEPEAHLHPQLAMLLADYLATETPAGNTPQTLLTTHSPTLAAHVPPNRMHVLFNRANDSTLCCNSLANARMTEPEEGELQRMMDVTRATLYFAKGVILVEGISESLLLPVLARRLGHDLAKEHISVVPICGVAFETFKKLLDPSALGIPAAIVTDADPPVERQARWEQDTPQVTGDTFTICDRTRKLLDIFNDHPTVLVKHSSLTLEYDLANAGDGNALAMAAIWESCYQRTPGTFNQKRVNDAGAERPAKALAAWRGICRADPSVSKAEFAHKLSASLGRTNDAGAWITTFDVPPYIRLAIEHVVNAVRPHVPTAAPAPGAQSA